MKEVKGKLIKKVNELTNKAITTKDIEALANILATLSRI